MQNCYILQKTIVVIFSTFWYLYSSVFSVSTYLKSPIIVTDFIPEKSDRYFLENKYDEKKSDPNQIELEDTSFFELKRGKKCKKIISSMEECTCAECRASEREFKKITS